jgi:hypothetical protein
MRLSHTDPWEKWTVRWKWVDLNLLYKNQIIPVIPYKIYKLSCHTWWRLKGKWILERLSPASWLYLANCTPSSSDLARTDTSTANVKSRKPHPPCLLLLKIESPSKRMRFLRWMLWSCLLLQPDRCTEWQRKWLWAEDFLFFLSLTQHQVKLVTLHWSPERDGWNTHWWCWLRKE